MASHIERRKFLATLGGAVVCRSRRARSNRAAHRCADEWRCHQDGTALVCGGIRARTAAAGMHRRPGIAQIANACCANSFSFIGRERQSTREPPSASSAPTKGPRIASRNRSIFQKICPALHASQNRAVWG